LTACVIAAPRSLTTKEREAIAAMADERPSICKSSSISIRRRSRLRRYRAHQLGNALAKPELKGSLVTISGHTDAKGAILHIKSFRSDGPRVSSDTWSTTSGFPPKTWSLSASKAEAEEHRGPVLPDNRRVQVVNLIHRCKHSVRLYEVTRRDLSRRSKIQPMNAVA
jgi:hypothetical protein